MSETERQDQILKLCTSLILLARTDECAFLEALAEVVSAASSEGVEKERRRCLVAARGDNQEPVDWHAEQHRDYEDVEARVRKMIEGEIEKGEQPG